MILYINAVSRRQCRCARWLAVMLCSCESQRRRNASATRFVTFILLTQGRCFVAIVPPIWTFGFRHGGDGASVSLFFASLVR